MKLIENDIEANGIKLHIYRTGTAKPPIVFFHGITDNGLCFTPIAEKLADEYEIILVDARGHGLSEAPEPALNIERAFDVAGLISALGLEKPTLVGHSLGAVAVALCAGLYPELPGRVILEDPPTFERFAAQGEEDKKARELWKAKAIQNQDLSVEALVEMNRQESPDWPEAERLPWAQAKKQFNINVFDESSTDAATGNNIVKQISCPTLLLTADPKMGAMMPTDKADNLVSILPAARHVNIQGSGHSIRREQPAAYLQAVNDFLKEAL